MQFATLAACAARCRDHWDPVARCDWLTELTEPCDTGLRSQAITLLTWRPISARGTARLSPNTLKALVAQHLPWDAPTLAAMERVEGNLATLVESLWPAAEEAPWLTVSAVAEALGQLPHLSGARRKSAAATLLTAAGPCSAAGLVRLLQGQALLDLLPQERALLGIPVPETKCDQTALPCHSCTLGISAVEEPALADPAQRWRVTLGIHQGLDWFNLIQVPLALPTDIAAWHRALVAHTARRLGLTRLMEPGLIAEVSSEGLQRGGPHRSGWTLRGASEARWLPDSPSCPTWSTLQTFLPELPPPTIGGH